MILLVNQRASLGRDAARMASRNSLSYVLIRPAQTGVRVFRQGDVIPYTTMCAHERENLQKGMNFRLHGGCSVILMSLRANAPYEDHTEDDGKTLIYEGHDAPRRQGEPDPKTVDQPMHNPSGTLTQNGLFYTAALRTGSGRASEHVRVYEKIKPGIWVYNGLFELVDAWQERSGGRKVFKFKLELLDDVSSRSTTETQDIEHTRLIPTAVKLEVWRRDKGCCVVCGRQDNLHFDHIIPYSKGGSSLVANNIQLMCVRHNLAKSARIE